uniref:Oligopeptide transporter 1-like isoform X1 n=3 Tax=Rhizophora mucronata TaxID=61149 RepID=A0A2P2KAG1_RHIMU
MAIPREEKGLSEMASSPRETDSSHESKLPEKHQFNMEFAGKEENVHPIEEVRLTIPITDDSTLPTLTFRTWVLGISACVLLSFINQFFGYRTNQLSVSSVTAQIVVLPLGKLMASTLPTKPIHVPFTKWKFSLNPGPFNLKEHVLITIFANCGSGGVYAVSIITSIKAFYRRHINALAAMLLVQTTQLLGYGWAGMFRQILVDSPYMWWPSNLIQVSLFRALHEKEKRGKGGLTRLQFFTIVFICSFAFYTVPGYLFTGLSKLSFVCWIWKDSITAQQIGSGYNGLGVGSFGLDWSTIAGFLGTPLATPFFAIANTLVGFVLVIYVITPILYWTNAYDAKKFPILSSQTFDSDGLKYNITRILDQKSFDINLYEYNNYSKLYLSVVFATMYGLSFATLMATISHVALFHGKTIWQLWRKATTGMKDSYTDVHTRLMKKNYESVPQWWFASVLGVSVALSFLAVEGFNRQLQLPWWGLLMACGIAFCFTLPIGIIQATTNMQMGLNVITELLIGYIYPGKPLANVAFKTYGYISMAQALDFLQDFKLGHYMKVPPKSMFLVQLVGTIVASTVYFGTSWCLLTNVKDICRPELLPDGSPWTCPGDDVFYNASIIWGVIGPLRMFTKKGVYPQMNWFFLIGFLAPFPVWLLSRKFPNQKWIRNIHMPILLSAYGLPARPVHYISWGAVGIFFNYYIYKRYKGWWARHNYILSAGMDAGLAFMAIIIFFTLQSKDISGPSWWGQTDQCPLATCPAAPGVKVKNCPVL